VYRKTSRELKRLDSVTRSPVYIHFDECLEGAAVIRSHGGEHLLRERVVCLSRLDENQRMCFASGAASQWLTFRLQVLF
jgi:ATP-binding cassette subfamily C (CFTR/MRP) protein 1